MKSILALAMLLLLVALGSSYDITVKCSSQGCASGCKQCQSLSGGPFQGLTSCVDKQGGCNKNSSFTISFNCKGCSNEIDCSYTVSQNASSFTGCTNSQDKIWLIYKGILDLLYVIVKQTNDPCDWCGTSCELSTGAIVGIVAAVLVVLGLLGGGIYCFIKRKNKSNDFYIKHSQSSLLG